MRFRIFISSVQDEFREERRELKQWILQNPLLSRYVESVFLFEDSPARGDGSQEVFLEEVARSQIYIGILGRRYCGRDHGDCEMSPTELEYDKAGACGLERFVYLLECAERDERQTAFVRKVNADVKRRSLGSGVRRMVNSCRKANVPNPAFEQAGPSFRVTFWFDQWTDSRLAQLKLNERQRMAVRFLKENALITAAQYAEMGTVVKRTAIRDLQELVEKEVVETVGVGKSISYTLKHLRDICATCATQSRQDCAIENSTVLKVAKLSAGHAIVEDKVENKLVSVVEKLVDGEKKLVFDGENVVLGDGNSTVNSTPGCENSTVGFGDSTVINGYGSLSKSLRRLVCVLGSECLGSKELCVRLGLKSRGALAQTYIRPALKAGLIMVVGGKTHSAQRAYRLMDFAKVNQ